MSDTERKYLKPADGLKIRSFSDYLKQADVFLRFTLQQFPVTVLAHAFVD